MSEVTLHGGALVYPVGAEVWGEEIPQSVWVVKKTYEPAHRCYVMNIRDTWEEYIQVGSVLQCSECLSYWRLYYLGSLPSWEQVVEDADGGFKPFRSRLIKCRNTTHGGWSRPWKVDA